MAKLDPCGTSLYTVVEPLAVLGIAYMSYLGAELFHFSGIISIIGCGLVQAHYALQNIAQNSRITVKYFTKMISSTSESVIFLFLGMVLVSNKHVWHTGFVLWTLLLCLVCRFFGVFLLTKIANLCRVRKINFQEQFMMAYGGLRGAVAFSLVEMLKEDEIKPQRIFLTTTLVVILFTVFIQGGTIKLFVNLLRIEKSQTGTTTMSEQINDFTISHVMAGIEEITGVRGDNYLRRKIEHIDEAYLGKIFLNTTKSNSLTRLYEKLALTQHYAHLYGPVTLVEKQKGNLLHSDTVMRQKKMAKRSQSVRMQLQDLFPGVEMRRRTHSATVEPEIPLIISDKKLTSDLKRAMRNTDFQKYSQRYSKNQLYEDDDVGLGKLLQRRQNRMKRITQTAGLLHRHSTTTASEGFTTDEEIIPFRRQIHSELETNYPEGAEGMNHILIRATKARTSRNSSNADVFAYSRRHTTSETNVSLDSSGIDTRAQKGWQFHNPVRRQHTIVTKHPIESGERVAYRPTSAEVSMSPYIPERSSALSELSSDVIVDDEESEESKV